MVQLAIHYSIRSIHSLRISVDLFHKHDIHYPMLLVIWNVGKSHKSYRFFLVHPHHHLPIQFAVDRYVFWFVLFCFHHVQHVSKLHQFFLVNHSAEVNSYISCLPPSNFSFDLVVKNQCASPSLDLLPCDLLPPTSDLCPSISFFNLACISILFSIFS